MHERSRARRGLRGLRVLRGRGLALSLWGLALVGCATGSQGQVADGERLLAEGKAREAVEVFREVLQARGTAPLDQARAALGEAKAFLALGDLSGAESRFKRLPDSTSAKPYYLGEIAFRRGDREGARERFLQALEAAHGGDTAWRLATLVGSEARTPATLVEAAAVARRGPFAKQASALEAVGEVWRKLDAGGSPERLAPELASAREGLDPWPSLGVLAARCLRGPEAEAAWSLSETQPEPTQTFRDYAAQLRARLARRAGDAEVLSEAIAGAAPEAARRIRSEVAASRLWRGDLEGALEVMERGPEEPRSLLLRALYLELLGRVEEAAALRAKLDASVGPLHAPTLAAEGDLLAVGALALPAELAPDTPQAAARFAQVGRAAELLAEALRRFAQGGAPPLSGLALLAPADPTAGALAGEGSQPLGASAAALAESRLERALRAGDLLAAAQLDPQLGLAGWRLLPSALALALREGGEGGLERTRAFLSARAEKLPPEVALRIRADEGLAELHSVLTGQKGLAAAGEGPADQRPWGDWIDPASGVRVAGVHLGAAGWEEPSGAPVALPEASAPRFETPRSEAPAPSAPLPPPRVQRGVSPQELP